MYSASLSKQRIYENKGTSSTDFKACPTDKEGSFYQTGLGAVEQFMNMLIWTCFLVFSSLILSRLFVLCASDIFTGKKAEAT